MVAEDAVTAAPPLPPPPPLPRPTKPVPAPAKSSLLTEAALVRQKPQDSGHVAFMKLRLLAQRSSPPSSLLVAHFGHLRK